MVVAAVAVVSGISPAVYTARGRIWRISGSSIVTRSVSEAILSVPRLRFGLLSESAASSIAWLVVTVFVRSIRCSVPKDKQKRSHLQSERQSRRIGGRTRGT